MGFTNIEELSADRTLEGVGDALDEDLNDVEAVQPRVQQEHDNRLPEFTEVDQIDAWSLTISSTRAFELGALAEGNWQSPYSS